MWLPRSRDSVGVMDEDGRSVTASMMIGMAMGMEMEIKMAKMTGTKAYQPHPPGLNASLLS